jgi:hypothetical protein
MSHTSSRLSSVDRDFIVIEKPFPLAIGIAVDLHQAALTRRAEDLDDGPDLVQEPRDRPPPLPNDDSIPDGRLTFRWQWEKHTARLFPGIVLDDAYNFVGGYSCFIVHSVRGIDRIVFGLHRLTW